MAGYLLLVAVVIFACVLLNKVTSKLGVPMLLAFILLGMLFGSDGLFKIPFDNYSFAEHICSVALIFIMFYGGFGTNWKQARPVAAKSILLSTVGVIVTAGLVGVFCHFVMKIELFESFLIGSVIGSTDAASVFSILRSKRLNLRDNTASLLEVESGSNDPCSYMLTAIFIAIIGGKASGLGLAYMIFAQIVYGILGGVIISIIAVMIMKKFRFSTAGFDMVFVVGVAVIAYAAPTVIGGNGYLSAYIVGIVLGNTEITNKRTLVNFFDGITGLMQMLIFFLLGLLSFPSQMMLVIVPALLIAVFLTLVARPIAVSAILLPFKSKLSQIAVVSWAGFRGAASIVFAIMAVMSVQAEHDIFHIVFFIVLFSISIQGSLLPFISKKCGMIDENEDVMKTFSDYSDQVPVQFIQFDVTANHRWCGKAVRDIVLPPDTLLVLLVRGEEKLVPKGKTLLREGDKLILTACPADPIEGIVISEIYVDEKHEYAEKKISELPKTENLLIIMIQRKGRVIIPRGDVKIHKGDTLVINNSEF